jgi:hypothetical protein
MNEINNYNYFYDKYLTKANVLIKNFFIKAKMEKRNFNYALEHLNSNLGFYSEDVIKNKKIKLLAQVFHNLKNNYEIDQEEQVLKNDFELHFKGFCTSFKQNYEYKKLIKEIAIIQVLETLKKLLSSNKKIFELMYIINDFTNFEIQDYGLILIENTEIYKSLSKNLKINTHGINKMESELEEINENKLSTTQKVLLIEKLMVSINWNSLSERKKAALISKIIDKNPTNVRLTLAKSGKKPSENTSQFNNDVLTVENLIKSLE